ncbi:hypothetical protein [Clostridium formicaceticum]|uniref:Uncharacterized protein n=1 Tax=Clostridium formicaceticum TaxID=1497 RepID=A0AAC9WF81_9CLOT|nr:hypothetical protein [Clostridium formicaceticum]AOY76123.1 hypothetical protein BJL90_09550 [Clostridium formicaceticum]ARE86491.1 hypothetical protein CLFO_08130 [Clostridium formicaceticum]
MGMDINFESLVKEIAKCCLGEEQCGTCEKESCLIGYCKRSLTTSLKQQSEFIDGGMEEIPYNDTKIYDDEMIVETIGFLLNQCKNCNLYHDEECIINIVRSALEIILLGEAQDYKGSTLFYLGDIKAVNEGVADRIFQAFQSKKNAS